MISTIRLVVYLLLSVGCMLFDGRGQQLAVFRHYTNMLAQPIWMLAALPGQIGQTIGEYCTQQKKLVAENRTLRDQLLAADARITRLNMIALDNEQMRHLLHVANYRGIDVQLATILDIEHDPTRQRLILNSGTRDGVHIGQPVIDAGGLMGQISDVAPFHATVLLITDPDHAVPVISTRTGVRLIAYGNGDTLLLRDIPPSAGIKVGDSIVTSGLGGRFPAGFPVGVVASLYPDATRAFLIGTVTPAAHLNRGREVLLLRYGSKAKDADTTPLPSAPSP